MAAQTASHSPSVMIVHAPLERLDRPAMYYQPLRLPILVRKREDRSQGGSGGRQRVRVDQDDVGGIGVLQQFRGEAAEAEQHQPGMG